MEYWDAFTVLARPSVTKPLRGIVTGAVLGVLALTALASIRVAFDLIKESQLKTAARHEAQLAAADGRTESAIRTEVLQRAQSLGIPLRPESIHIHATPPPPEDQTTGNFLTDLGVSTHTPITGHVEISISYDVPYRYPGGATASHLQFVVSDQDI
jgi:hypothetical protein